MKPQNLNVAIIGAGWYGCHIASIMLETDSSYLTNTEIELNGGKFARMKT